MTLTFNKSPQPSEIPVSEEKNTLEIYPPVVDVPIRLKKVNKFAIHSMIPGRAQHYFQKVILETGSALEFFQAIADNPGAKGYFIGTLETQNDVLKNVTICVASETISYLDAKTGENKIVTIVCNSPKTYAVAEDERLAHMAKTLTLSHPLYDDVVAFSTGGQSSVWDILQQIKDNFTCKENAEGFYKILKAAMSNEASFYYHNYIDNLPKTIQLAAVRFLIEQKKDPKMFKDFLERGYINEKNWKLVRLLPSPDQGTIYDILMLKGTIRKNDVEDILALIANLDWVVLIERYISKEKVIDTADIWSIYHYICLGFSFPEHHPQLLSIFGRKEFVAEIGFLKLCNKFRETKLASMITFVENTLPHIPNKQDAFQSLIKDLLEKPAPIWLALPDLLENLTWLKSYNEKQKIIEENEFQKLIITSCQTGFQNSLLKTDNPISNTDRKGIVELISKIKEIVPLDEKSMTPLYLERDPFLFRNLITPSFLSSNPDVIPIALNDLISQGYRGDLEYFDHMENMLKFSDQHKKKLLNRILSDATRYGHKDLIQKLSSWFSLISESEKQELLINAFKSNREFLLTLLSLGLDMEHPEFLDVLLSKMQIIDWINFPYYVKHLRKALDIIPNEKLEYQVNNYYFGDGFSKELLNYIFIDRKLSDKDKTISNLLRWSLISIKTSEDNNRQTTEEHMHNAEWTAELCVKLGANLEGMTTLIEDLFAESTIPRLVSDGCSFALVDLILKCKPQTAAEKVYDRILLAAAMKGRVDVLKLLENMGCRYSSEMSQKAIFYSIERGSIEMQEIIKKMITA